MSGDKTLKQALISRQKVFEDLYLERGWRDYYRQIKYYALPDRGRSLTSEEDWTEVNDASKNDRRFMLDDTLEADLNFLAAGIQQFATPKKSPWFRANILDKELNRNRRVRMWLDTVTERMQQMMAAGNFYDSEYSMILEMCGFGTGCMMIEEDLVEGIRARSFTAGEYVISLNEKLQINSFIRQVHMTVRQIVEKFGLENASQSVRNMFKNGQREKRRLIYHLIEPNGQLPVSLPPELEMPFISIYWERGEPQVLEVGGFFEFPIVCPRWSVIGNDTFGKESPGQTQLNNSRELQARRNDAMEADEKAVRPPLIANTDIPFIDTNPNGITRAPNALGGNAQISSLFEFRYDQQAGFASIQFVRDMIHERTFRNLFQVIQQAEGDRKTATEIMALNSEKFTMLAPTIDRFDHEFGKPGLNLIYTIMNRQERFPEPPPEIEGAEFEFEFTSILAQAAKAVVSNNIDRFLQRMVPLFEVYPEVRHILDPFLVAEQYADNDAVPAEVLRTLDDAQLMAAQEAEAAAKQQEAEMQQQNSQSVKNLATSPTNTDSALTEAANA